MKKLAYTLAEVLITLSIIGIIAAVAAPAITSAKPDVNKMQYLKIYDHLTKLTMDMASNPRIYAPLCQWVNNQIRDVSHLPLMNTETSADRNFENCPQNNEKYGCILKIAMGGEGQDWDFVTPDNNRWQVANYGRMTDVEAGIGSSWYIVTVTISGLPNNGLYDAAHPEKKPNQFDFFVTKDGSVHASDVCGQMYVATRLQPNSRKSYAELIREGGYVMLFNRANAGSKNTTLGDITAADWPVVNQ